jgi:hypothetical protein
MTSSAKQIVARLEDELNSVLARLDSIESRIAHNGGPPLDDEPTEDRRLSKRKLAERWAVSTRSIDRAREDDPDFPAPERDYPGGPTYFWLSAIKKYERQRAARIEQPFPRSTAAARAKLKQMRAKRKRAPAAAGT